METDSIKALVAENKWQVLRDSENSGYGVDVLVRYLPGIMRSDFPATIAYLKALGTITNPKTTPEGPWTGTYNIGRIWYEKAQDGVPGKSAEGTYTVYMTLWKGGSSEADIVTENGCRYAISQTWYFHYATLVALPASSSGITYSRTSPVKNDETGAWTYAIETRQRLYQNVSQYTSERDNYEFRERTQHVGVYNGDVKDDGITDIGLPSLATQTAGSIVEIQRSKNEDCTQDIDVIKRTAIERSSADASGEVSLSEERTTTLNRNQAAAESIPTSQTDGQIKLVKVHKNEFAKYDNEITIRTATAVSEASKSKIVEKFEEITETKNDNQTAITALPTTQTAGEITKVQNDKNEFNRYDTTITTRKSTNVQNAEVESVISKFETQTKAIDRNAAAAASVPGTQTAGSIVDVASKINDFNKYDTTIITRTAANEPLAEQQKVISKFASESRVTKRNETNAGTLPTSQSPGTIVEVSDRFNEFSLHDVTTNTRTALEALDAEVERTIASDETIDRVQNRNTTAATLPTTFTAGTIVELINRLNEYAKYDVSTTTRTATLQQFTKSYAHRYGTAYVSWGRNATAQQFSDAITAADLISGSTWNNSVVPSINKYGLFDYVIVKEPTSAGHVGIGESGATGTITHYEFGQVFSTTDNRSVRAKRLVTVAYTLTWHATTGAAYSQISGGYEGSHVFSENGLAAAYSTIVSRGNWVKDETFAS
jgi:hypothetical protein